MVKASACACFVCLFAAPALAQQVPATAQPGAIEREQRPLPEARSLSPLPGVTVKEAPAAQAPPGAADISFMLRTLSVEGNTVISDGALLDRFKGQVGQTITVERVYQMAAEMTARYRDAGYVLSSVVVPAQEIKNGEVSFTAVEGYLSSVTFEGDTGRRDGLFAAIEQDLKAERPLRLATLERNLLLLNDLPGTVAQGVLQRSSTEPGGSELTIGLQRRAFGLDADVNNRGSEVQGPIRYGVGVTANSLLGALGETRFSFLAADPTSELKYGFLSHRARLTASGLELLAYGSKSRSEPDLGVDFSDFNLETDTDQVGLELKYPWIRTRDHNLYVRGGLTYHDGVTDSAFEDEQTRDTISAIRVGLTFDDVDTWGGVNLLDLELSQGIDAFGASDKDDPGLSRNGGDPEFTKAALYLARLQTLGHGWSVLIAGNGQYAFTNLLVPEEFAMGGEICNRAYDPSEVVGDSGVCGKLEVRYTLDALGRGGLTAYSFYDTGYVWQRLGPDERQGPDASEHDGASSWGGGIRFTLAAWLTGYVEAAVPIDQIVVAEGNDDPRFFAGIRVQFGSEQLNR
jgi:hemolysin activation/secretion protein